MTTSTDQTPTAAQASEQTAAAPYCEDCRWYRGQFFGDPRCANPALRESSLHLVNRSTAWMRLCEAARRAGERRCGPAGAAFEPRR